jgi:hypothetical protein
LTPAGPEAQYAAVRSLRLLAAAGVLALASPVSGESLGEAAAREQVRRDAARRKDGPAVVVDEEQLKKASGRIANDPAIAPAVTSSPVQFLPPVVSSGALLTEKEAAAGGFGITRYVAPAPSAQEDIRSRETYWRSEARRRREQAAAAEEVLKDVERWSDPTYAGPDRPSCPITVRSDQRKARAEAARARAELRSLDEEARAGGALPGWIRE